jgi:hypothetical protein
MPLPVGTSAGTSKPPWIGWEDGRMAKFQIDGSNISKAVEADHYNTHDVFIDFAKGTEVVFRVKVANVDTIELLPEA